MLTSAVIFKIYSFVGLNKKKQYQATSLQWDLSWRSWRKKLTLRFYHEKIVVEAKGGARLENILQRLEKLVVSAAETWTY